jgi:hypothetical protein
MGRLPNNFDPVCSIVSMSVKLGGRFDVKTAGSGR